MLFEKLKAYGEGDVYPFHMPGHKRRMEPFNPYSIDITEIGGFDDLHSPHGAIYEAQEECARVFGALESFFLINGASCGIISSVLSVCGDGSKIIAARNSHRSFFGGLILSGAVPHYIMPKICEGAGFCGGISTESVLEAVLKNPDASAIFITSPTTEGITSDIRAIADIAHENNMLLIVDSAHGAHFHFSDYFPEDALSQGADIVIESVHKTLPSLTQTSLLHTGSLRPDMNRLKSALSITQSTSPSYVLMGSIDRCVSFVKNGGEAFKLYTKRLNEARKAISRLSAFRLLDRDMIEDLGACDIDRGKISLVSPFLSGVRLAGILRESYGIEPEMSSEGHIVLITSVADTDEGFSRLVSALSGIDGKIDKSKGASKRFLPYVSLPEMAVTPREAYFSAKKEKWISESASCVSAEFIVPYPPGIPLIVPGERITEEIIKTIEALKSEGTELSGIEDKEVKKIKVLSRETP